METYIYTFTPGYRDVHMGCIGMHLSKLTGSKLEMQSKHVPAATMRVPSIISLKRVRRGLHGRTCLNQKPQRTGLNGGI